MDKDILICLQALKWIRLEPHLPRLQRFTVSIKELAEWFGLEVARIVVDEPASTTELTDQIPPTLLSQV
jgi:hypothetical protein